MYCYKKKLVWTVLNDQHVIIMEQNHEKATYLFVKCSSYCLTLAINVTLHCALTLTWLQLSKPHFTVHLRLQNTAVKTTLLCALILTWLQLSTWHFSVHSCFPQAKGLPQVSPQQGTSSVQGRLTVEVLPHGQYLVLADLSQGPHSPFLWHFLLQRWWPQDSTFPHICNKSSMTGLK